jgi:hypothetical protein
LPVEVTYFIAWGPGWRCVESGREVTCNLTGSLAAGATAGEIFVLVSVNSDTPVPGPIVNTATVASAAPDPDGANNTATEVTAAQRLPACRQRCTARQEANKIARVLASSNVRDRAGAKTL